MSGLVDAVALLTRVPVGARIGGSPQLARSVPWFPVVGAGVGLVIAVVYVGVATVLPAFIAATLASVAGAILTGAFHEDGLADVADSFAGGWSPEQRLTILDDPRHGTFGVLALVSSFLVRVAAIGSLDAWSAFALIPAAHAMSRVGGIVLLRRLPLAHPEGVGASYGAALTRTGEAAGALTGFALTVLLIGTWAIPAFVLCGIVAWGMGTLARAKIGGVAGDVLGATQQVAELGMLLLGVIVLREEWGTLAWWVS